MIKLYREPTGDFLAMDTDSIEYYKRIGKPDIRECRATAIRGDRSSLCTTGASTGFLKRCKRVELADIPQNWHYLLGLDTGQSAAKE